MSTWAIMKYATKVIGALILISMVFDVVMIGLVAFFTASAIQGWPQ